MGNSKFKIFLCLALCLAVFSFFIDGEAYAMGSSKGNKKKASGNYAYNGYNPPAPDGRIPDRPLNKPIRVPEPTTLILLGISLMFISVIGKKKFKKVKK